MWIRLPFLTGSIPNLGLDDLIVHPYAPSRKLNPNRGLSLDAEFIAGESWQQVRFPDARVPNQNHLEQVIVVIVRSISAHQGMDSVSSTIGVPASSGVPGNESPFLWGCGIDFKDVEWTRNFGGFLVNWRVTMWNLSSPLKLQSGGREVIICLPIIATDYSWWRWQWKMRSDQQNSMTKFEFSFISPAFIYVFVFWIRRLIFWWIHNQESDPFSRIW